MVLEIAQMQLLVVILAWRLLKQKARPVMIPWYLPRVVHVLLEVGIREAVALQVGVQQLPAANR